MPVGHLRDALLLLMVVNRFEAYKLYFLNGHLFLFLNGHPSLFSVYFCLSKQSLQLLQQLYVKNVHPVNNAGIQTHNHQNMSLLP